MAIVDGIVVIVELPISIVIPTYRREQVLLDTLQYLLALPSCAAEIIVVDQTQQHADATEISLATFASNGQINWVRVDWASIPKAMNLGLCRATQPLVLFLDDDIRPDSQLVAAHIEAHRVHHDIIAAGRVLQPWHMGKDFSADGHFHFASLNPRVIKEFMGGNFSIRRDSARSLGGFDENFVQVAYRFEAEFAHRFVLSRREIRFVPQACIDHLKSADGGTRAHGKLLTTMRPSHSVGNYYFILRTKPWWNSLAMMCWQPFRSVATRHHLRNPWWILPSFIAEMRGVWWALRLIRRGPRYIDPTVDRPLHG